MCALERLYTANAYRKILIQLRDSIARLHRGDPPAEVLEDFTMETRAHVVDTVHQSFRMIQKEDPDAVIEMLSTCIQDIRERTNQ